MNAYKPAQAYCHLAVEKRGHASVVVRYTREADGARTEQVLGRYAGELVTARDPDAELERLGRLWGMKPERFHPNSFPERAYAVPETVGRGGAKQKEYHIYVHDPLLSGNFRRFPPLDEPAAKQD
jgi:hypothetical protein